MTYNFTEDKSFEEFTNPLHYPFITKTLIGKRYHYIEEITDLIEQLDGDVRLHSSNPNSPIIIELKMDRHIKSPNLFLEEISNTRKGTLGCTLKTNADILSYGYYDMDTSSLIKQYIYNMPLLKAWFKENKDNYRKFEVKNKWFSLLGRIVPRKDVSMFLINKWKIPIKIMKLSDFF